MSTDKETAKKVFPQKLSKGNFWKLKSKFILELGTYAEGITDWIVTDETPQNAQDKAMYRKNKAKAFTYILDSLSPSAMGEVRADQGFQNILEKTEPKQLWPIVVEALTEKNVVVLDRRKEFQRKTFLALEQLPGENVRDFASRVLLAQEHCVLCNVVNTPGEVTNRFTLGLEPVRNSLFLAKYSGVRKQEENDPTAHVMTFGEAVEEAVAMDALDPNVHGRRVKEQTNQPPDGHVFYAPVRGRKGKRPSADNPNENPRPFKKGPGVPGPHGFQGFQNLPHYRLRETRYDDQVPGAQQVIARPQQTYPRSDNHNKRGFFHNNRGHGGRRFRPNAFGGGAARHAGGGRPLPPQPWPAPRPFMGNGMELPRQPFGQSEQPRRTPDFGLVARNYSFMAMEHWGCGNVEGAESLFVFDNACTKTVYNKHSNVYGITPLRYPRMIQGAGGLVTVNFVAIHPYFGPGLYHADFETNLVSAKQMRVHFATAYDDGQDFYTLTVRKGTGDGTQIKTSSKLNLYVFQEIPGVDLWGGERCAAAVARDYMEFLDSPAQTGTLVPLVQSNAADIELVEFEQRVKERALMTAQAVVDVNFESAAYDLHRKLDHANMRTMEQAMSKRLLYPDSGVTAKTIRDAEYCKDCRGCLLGKMTDAPLGTSPIRSMIIGEHIHADIVFVRGDKRMLTYFLGVEQVTNYAVALRMESKKMEEIVQKLEAIKGHFAIYERKLKYVHADHESSVLKAKTNLMAKEIAVVQVAAYTHEKKVERNVRSVRDKIRATLQGLPYKLPLALLPYLFVHVVQSLNMTPNSLTTPYTPSELLTGEPASARYLRFAFGTFGRFHEPDTTGTEPRGALGLCIGRCDQSSALLVYRLRDQRIVSRDRFIPERITPDVVQALNGISEKKDWPESLEEAIRTDMYTPPSTPQLVIDRSHADDDLREPGILGDAPPSDSFSILQPSVLDSSHKEKLSLVAEGVKAIEPVAPEIGNMVSEILESALGGGPKEEGKATEESLPETGEERAKRRKHTVIRDYAKMNSYGFSAVECCFEAAEIDPTNLKESVTKAVDAELEQMLDLDVFQFLTPMQAQAIKGRILPTKIIITEKRDARGVLIKVKARLVVLGNLQYGFPEDYDKSSPTVRIETIMFVLHFAVLLGLAIDVMDVGGAFLEAELDTEEYVSINKDLVENLVRLFPGVFDFVDRDGKIVVRLKKAMYGLKESPMAWYQCLKKALAPLGFEPSEHDSALLVRRKDGKIIHLLGVHVDDLVSAGRRDSMVELNLFLKRRFKKITSFEDLDAFDYLKMEVVRDRQHGTVTLKQPNYIAEVVESFGMQDVIETVPYTEKLFQVEQHSKPCDSERYRSLVAKLMWISRLRPDIKLPVNYLSTRVTECTESDYRKACRVAGYLNGTKDLGLVFRPTTFELFCSADASFAVHPDQKGQSGYTIHFGEHNAPFHVASKKQRLVTMSSTESELVSLTEAAQMLMSMREFLQSLDLTQGTSIVEQDNKASILLSNRGPGRAGRAKAISVRYFWITQHIESQAIKLRYVPSEQLLADGLTKPLPRDRFLEFRNRILNCTI